MHVHLAMLVFIVYFQCYDGEENQ